MLEIWLKNCAAAGISQVLINIHAHAEKVKEFLRQQTSGVQVRISEETELLGSAGTLAENKDFVERAQAFFILYGDVLTNADLSALWRFHREKNVLATLGVYRVADPTQCGVVVMDEDGMVKSFVEKPAQAESNFAFSGVMVARPEILRLIPEQRPADISFHLLPKLVGKMAACKAEGFVLDIGTMSSYTAAQSSWPG